jgi:DNA polymerase I-like protein with 3'-5' exonuclease and polymerase domains
MAVVIDVETTGLDCRRDRLVAVGVAFGRDDPIVLRHPADRDLVQQALELDAIYIGHNIGFDMGFLQSNCYWTPHPSRWLDTILVAHVAGERLPGRTRLESLQKQLVAAGELPAEILEPEQRIRAWLRKARKAAKQTDARRPEKGDAPADILDPYLSADVVSTRAVARHWGRLLDGQQQVLVLEQRCLPAVFAAERRGVPLDLDAARELRDRTEASAGDLRARCFELAGRAFNPNAALQIERALVDRGADLTQVPRTPRAAMPMFTAATLAAIDDDLARALLDYRGEKKLYDYVTGLWAHTHGDRLYGGYRQVGTETGRMSSGNPNLQNIPRSDLRIRYVICAGEGRVLVGADQDNVELRVLAAYAGPGRLRQAFAEGADLHQRTADSLGLGRDEAKTLNYSVTFGGGAPLIAGRLGCSIAEAENIRNGWFAQYPEVRRLRSRLWRKVQRDGFLTTIGGRRHHFPDGPNHMLLQRLVSGSAADMFKAAAIELHELHVPLVLLIHDEMVAEVDEDQAEDTGRLLEAALSRGMGQIRRLKADASIHKRWSDFKQPGWTPDLGEEVNR